MNVHKIIGGISVVILFMSVMFLIWTDISWIFLLKLIATSLIVLKIVMWYDEYLEEED